MPPAFRRKSSFTRNPLNIFKLVAGALVLFCYTIFCHFRTPLAPRNGATIQWAGFINGTGVADEAKAKQVVEAMKHSFNAYRENAWGADGIMPMTGGGTNNMNGWGAFPVESASTLVLMGMWEELDLVVSHILNKADFETAPDLVDPFEATTRYLGGIVSLVDLVDAGGVPKSIVTNSEREALIKKAVSLARKLGPAYDSPTNMPWPRVNFASSTGVDEPHEDMDTSAGQSKPPSDHPSISPARAGTSILENRALSRLTHDPVYFYNSTLGWSKLVWTKYYSPAKGMVNGPIDIITGEPVGRQYHWDDGHGSYYEYLLKMTLLSPRDRYSWMYKKQFERAAYSLRDALSSRNRPSKSYPKQHLFLGGQDDQYELNQQSHVACSAVATVLLGGAHGSKKAFTTLGQALLEACHHTYNSTATGIGPYSWAWYPKFGKTKDATFVPQSGRQEREWAEHGFWITDAHHRLQPEYAEALFYAWRVTGEQRYREWAWQAFQAIERYCKTEYGYAGLRDVMALPTPAGVAEDGTKAESRFQQVDEMESYWVGATLKYYYLIFADSGTASLDRWVFSHGGHLFRMIR